MVLLTQKVIRDSYKKVAWGTVEFLLDIAMAVAVLKMVTTISRDLGN